MLGLTTEYKLATVLQAISNGEKDIEVSRQVLAELSAFEPYTAFKRMTRRPTGSLSVYQIVDFLRENDVLVLEKDVRNVVGLYSSTGRLSYTDFLELVLPRHCSTLREVCTKRASYYVADDEILPYEVELGLAKVFDKEINLSRKVELLKEDLVSRFDFNLRAAYEVLVEAGEGRVDFDAFYTFFKKNGVTIIDRDINALLRRIDVDRDGKLTFSEFSEAILPVNEYYRRLGETSVRSKPSLRTSTPSRSRVVTRVETRTFSPTSKKLTNADYYEYLSESATLANARRSVSPKRTASPLRSATFKEEVSGYTTPTKTRNVESPTRSPTRFVEPVSPMKGNEEDHFVRALIEQVELDKELEGARNKLALQDDFNLFDSFRFFDLTENGFVTRTELREGLNDFDVFPSTNELYLVMKKYNKSQDGLLKYSEFCDILRPKDAGYARLLTDRKPSYADKAELPDVFSDYTIELFKRVLNKAVENEFHSEKLRQKLSRRPLFDRFEAFEALDKSKIGFLTKDEFKDLLGEHGFYATQKELQTLVDRFDKDEDGKVTYSEFVREITPKSPEKI